MRTQVRRWIVRSPGRFFRWVRRKRNRFKRRLRVRIGVARRARARRKTPRKALRAGPRRPPKHLPRQRFVEDEWWAQRSALAGPRVRWLRRLAFYPPGRQNPYLRLLYGRCPEMGFDPRPIPRMDELFRLPPDSVFHLHWTRAAQGGATSEDEARQKTERFLAPIRDFTARGGTLLWSVHEALPHDCPFPALEIELRKELVQLAARVHVLHESTLAEVADLYPLDPAKVLLVEHPLYRDVYPAYYDRNSARRLLGLEPDEVLLLGFGAIRPYKGFDRLVRMLDRLREETGRRVRVMIAGPTLNAIDNSKLVHLVGTTFGASITDEGVAEEHVQVLFKAADVVVLPYRDVLNSGVLMLGLSFGRRSVAPENDVTRDALDSELVHLFDRSSDEDLFRAVREAIEAGPGDGTLPAEFAARYDPSAIGASFAGHLRELCERSRAPQIAVSAGGKRA